MSPPIAYFNGRFLPAAEVSIPLDDAGFVWGATVTDRARTFNGKLFRVSEHLHRFRGSCWASRVPLLETDEKLSEIAEQLVQRNRRSAELSVIWIATPGRLSTENRTPTVIAYTEEIDACRWLEVQRNGISLAVVRTLQNGSSIKHRSRLSWWRSQAIVRDHYPAALPLFVTHHAENVLETPTSNVLVVFDDRIVSPKDEVLEGVSLGVIQELCHRNEISFLRRDLKEAELASASEILLSNTTDSVAGVSKLNGQPVPFPGPILHRLLDAWSDLVGVNLRADLSPS